jgi:hypothetical protein
MDNEIGLAVLILHADVHKVSCMKVIHYKSYEGFILITISIYFNVQNLSAFSEITYSYVCSFCYQILQSLRLHTWCFKDTRYGLFLIIGTKDSAVVSESNEDTEKGMLLTNWMWSSACNRVETSFLSVVCTKFLELKYTSFQCNSNYCTSVPCWMLDWWWLK